MTRCDNDRLLRNTSFSVLNNINDILCGHVRKSFIVKKKEGNDQESIQSSTTPDPGYQWERDNVTIRHQKREPRG